MQSKLKDDMTASEGELGIVPGTSDPNEISQISLDQ